MSHSFHRRSFTLTTLITAALLAGCESAHEPKPQTSFMQASNPSTPTTTESGVDVQHPNFDRFGPDVRTIQVHLGNRMQGDTFWYERGPSYYWFGSASSPTVPAKLGPEITGRQSFTFLILPHIVFGQPMPQVPAPEIKVGSAVIGIIGEVYAYFTGRYAAAYVEPVEIYAEHTIFTVERKADKSVVITRYQDPLDPHAPADRYLRVMALTPDDFDGPNEKKLMVNQSVTVEATPGAAKPWKFGNVKTAAQANIFKTLAGGQENALTAEFTAAFKNLSRLFTVEDATVRPDAAARNTLIGSFTDAVPDAPAAPASGN